MHSNLTELPENLCVASDKQGQIQRFVNFKSMVSEQMGCAYDGWLWLEHQMRLSTDKTL